MGHACGHKITGYAGAEAATAAALVLRHHTQSASGGVKVSGNPAAGGGAKALLTSAGACDGVDIGAMSHQVSLGAVHVARQGPTSLEVAFGGRGAQVSAAPETVSEPLMGLRSFWCHWACCASRCNATHVHMRLLSRAAVLLTSSVSAPMFAYSPGFLVHCTCNRPETAIRLTAAGAALATGRRAPVSELAPAYGPLIANRLLSEPPVDALAAVGLGAELQLVRRELGESTDMGMLIELC